MPCVAYKEAEGHVIDHFTMKRMHEPDKEASIALTSAQDAELARRLESLNDEVREKIRGTLSPLAAEQKHIDLSGMVYDPGDESVARLLEGLDHVQLERSLRELREVEAARTRRANGDINRCVECGGEIGYERLRAFPVATRCIRCQTLHERRYRSEATPKL
jgi:RNA polymerase-binding transcription factor